MNFKLRQLEGFVAAAEEGAFSRAANRMSTTQPAFSQLIRELENAVGMRLFERTTRRMELTEAGRTLLSLVRRPLDDLRFAEQSLRELAGGERGTVTFAALPSAAFQVGTRAIARFRVAYPGVLVRQIEDQNDLMVEKVLNREVDFALGMLAQGDPGLRFDAMFEDELVVVLPNRHPLTKRKTVAWKELVSRPLILLPAPSSVRRLADVGLAMAGSHRDPDYEVVNMVTALRMVREGLGLTILPLMAIDSMKMTGMTYRHLGEPQPKRQVGIIARTDRPFSPATEALIKLLSEEAARV